MIVYEQTKELGLAKRMTEWKTTGRGLERKEKKEGESSESKASAMEVMAEAIKTKLHGERETGNELQFWRRIARVDALCPC